MRDQNLLRNPYRAFFLLFGLLAFAGCGGEEPPLEETSAAAVGDPRITNCLPGNGAPLDSAIACNLALVGAGVDANTLNANTVRLVVDGAAVGCRPGTSGGRDSITCTPTGDLRPQKTYTFSITTGVKDEAGRSFAPFSYSFTTGQTASVPLSIYPFQRTQVHAGSDVCFSIVVGPDGKLYCSSAGKILRWDIQANGTLTNRVSFAPGFLQDSAGPRVVIGMAFRARNELWISENSTLNSIAPDYSGRVMKLTWAEGAPFTPASVTFRSHVRGLPRSARDHLSNSLVFHNGALYLSQGSNTAMGGAKDDAWENRPERLFSAAILRIDPNGTGIVDVRPTSEGGTYNPNAPGARLTIFATGVRNAYDLLWHSNGKLFVATNGSAAGGRAPGCEGAPQLDPAPTQNDYLFRVTAGKYYGHPNPVRGECILNRGNVANNVGAGDVVTEGNFKGYPLGTAPDPNYDGFVFNFGRNRSPNGTLEYHHGNLNRKIMVTRWSAGDDVLVMTPAATGNIDLPTLRRLNCAGRFENPIDLAEDQRADARNGNLYVAEMLPTPTGYSSRIQLCRPQF